MHGSSFFSKFHFLLLLKFCRPLCLPPRFVVYVKIPCWTKTETERPLKAYRDDTPDLCEGLKGSLRLHRGGS